MSQALRFLLAGPGLIGKKHAALIQSRPDAELQAIIAPDREENTAFAEFHGVPLSIDLETVLDQDPFDAAIISSPTNFHFDQTMACIARRIPVLVEKPVTDRLETAYSLAKAVDDSGVPVLVGHHRTYSTLLSTAEDFMRSSDFGRLVTVSGSALFYKPERYFLEGEWRAKPGGGPILINLIHEIGLMRHFCGEINSVFAFANNEIRSFEVEDTVALNFTFESGALGTFILSDVAASSKSWEMTSGENPAYPYFPDEDCYHFAGTNGSIDFPSMRIRTYKGAEEASWWQPFHTTRLDATRSDPLERQLAHFVDVIRGTATPLVSAQDSFRNMLVIEAIHRSLESGQIVRPDSLVAELTRGPDYR
ncbi:Predicted dehydrogenase [Roseovarius azorensis]|uniref:Predicted dehydrogenase n=1 Tax=Roseovarius azorensis TaxID=1287727 RepID=A0A1H7QHK4_9RHOB|nr:Gfo/Idh/MocA family oxidoreductase [Roseovarius azorensis]SEL47452.1 Predicted dehydrogenase [Roseovarius azorensis]